MNKVMLAGNLGQDPELRMTNGGQAVLKFSMGTTERVKKNDGYQDYTEWHRVIVWGKRGESLSNILAKGRFVVVEGKNRTRSWEDRDGNKRSTTEVIAHEVHLGPAPHGSKKKQEPRPEENHSFGDDPDDDIPF